MSLFAREQPADTVSLPIQDVTNIGQAARSFGARTRLQARLNPGGFERPFVGNPDHYYFKALKVFRTVVKADPELKALHREALASSRSVVDDLALYDLDGSHIIAPDALSPNSARMNEILTEKRVEVPLAGKWRERAIDISDFAIRVISGSDLMLGKPALYPGLPSDTSVNQPEYWYDLSVQLSSTSPAPEGLQPGIDQ